VPIPPAPNRVPLTIRDGVIDIGANRTRFTSEPGDGLLRSYLVLLRRTRDQKHAATITLRRDDIEVIAQYVDSTAEVVIGRLADLMGSTRTQRTAMLTMFATGAMLIASTGPVAADSRHSPVPEFVSGPAPAVIEIAAPPEADDSRSTARPAIVVEADGQIGSRGDRVEVTVDVEHPLATTVEIKEAEPAPGLSATVGPQAASRPNIEHETGVTHDGSIVAVGQPPVPHHPVQHRLVEHVEHETGVTDDGSIVAVGQEPAP